MYLNLDKSKTYIFFSSNFVFYSFLKSLKSWSCGFLFIFGDMNFWIFSSKIAQRICQKSKNSFVRLIKAIVIVLYNWTLFVRFKLIENISHHNCLLKKKKLYLIYFPRLRWLKNCTLLCKCVMYACLVIYKIQEYRMCWLFFIHFPLFLQTNLFIGGMPSKLTKSDLINDGI